MMKFLIKGLIRDRSRSRLPIIVTAIGVMLTVFLHAYITGFMGETIEMNAKFTYGHLKVMTRAYAENMDQAPNDLALYDAGDRVRELQTMFPEVSWFERIRFGGLMDVPDEKGETKGQGAAIGLGIDLLSAGSPEADRLNLEKSVTSGRMPQKRGEVLISRQFADKLGITPGEQITLIGSTMEGALAMHNFTVSGTLHFGVEIMDRGSIIADLSDVRQALRMEGAAGEIVGFLREGFYDDDQARQITSTFNEKNNGSIDEFVPVMKTLSDQGTMGTYVSMTTYWSTALSIVFIVAMSLVLWNAGLLGGLRRYGEVGVRLAMGEEKVHVFKTLLWESVFIGLAGSLLGTALGLIFSWLIQTYGINIEGLMKGAAVMIPTEIRSRITPADYYLGFLPGLISTVLGTALSGIGIFKRQTARLFKELEA